MKALILLAVFPGVIIAVVTLFAVVVMTIFWITRDCHGRP